KLFNQQGLNKFIKIRNFIQIFSTSLMWIMISISFYNFIFLRNSIYLLYSLSMLGIWMLFFGHRGSALEMLSFFDPQITLNILYSILPLTVFFGLQYICKLMQIEKTLPVPGRILQILVYSLFALFVLQIFISFDTVFFLTHLTSLITLILFTIFSIAAALKGSRSSKLTALPTFFMMLFMGIMHIHNLNIFSINQFAAAIILILTPLDLIYISVVHKIWRNETASSFSKGSTVLISGIKIDNEIQMMPYNKIHDKNILQDEPQHSAETQIASGLKHNSTSTACAEKKKTIYLKQDRIQDHISRLNKVMMEDKLFLLEDLRASQLASALDIKTHHLTELLNKHMGVSFPDLVKKYRVEESIQLIKENPEKKFITIAFETGFQSKSAFNRSFKEVTGLTPNEYRMGLRFNSNL
ncbi:MAG: helix-turn-helix domain-containing protein, partial [Spirochaetia bacterium]|nr:helix-turn-helix domain-containing protein [Spirochaetia bacterium]